MVAYRRGRRDNRYAGQIERASPVSFDVLDVIRVLVEPTLDRPKTERRALQILDAHASESSAYGNAEPDLRAWLRRPHVCLRSTAFSLERPICPAAVVELGYERMLGRAGA